AAKRRPYVWSGPLFPGAEARGESLRLLDDRQRHVTYERSYFSADEPGYAFRFLDQDVLNAVLQSSADPETFEVLPFRLAPMPPFEGVELIDPGSLRCGYADGTETYAVHHVLPEKPWLKGLYDGVYVRLLRRLLGGDDLAISVPREELPLRLRGGALAFAEQKRINAGQQLRWRVGDPLAARLRSSRPRGSR
ncbi:MAG: hypothetical protein ACR2OC_10210, partial [Solirubrobacterales bacterium]